MGAIEKTVSAIVEKVGPICQLVVVCGRNKKLVQKLQARHGPPSHAPLADDGRGKEWETGPNMWLSWHTFTPQIPGLLGPNLETGIGGSYLSRLTARWGGFGDTASHRCKLAEACWRRGLEPRHLGMWTASRMDDSLSSRFAQRRHAARSISLRTSVSRGCSWS